MIGEIINLLAQFENSMTLFEEKKLEEYRAANWLGKFRDIDNELLSSATKDYPSRSMWLISLFGLRHSPEIHFN